MSINNLEVRTTNQPKMRIDQVIFVSISYLTVNLHVIHVFISVMFAKSGIHNLLSKPMLNNLEKQKELTFLPLRNYKHYHLS